MKIFRRAAALLLLSTLLSPTAFPQDAPTGKQDEGKARVAVAMPMYRSARLALGEHSETEAARLMTAVVAEWDARQSEFFKTLRTIPEDEQGAFIEKSYPAPRDYAARVRRIVTEHPEDPATPAGLSWILGMTEDQETRDWAIDLVLEKYPASDAASAIVRSIGGRIDDGSRTRLSSLAKHESPRVAVAARFALAQDSRARAGLARRLAGADETATQRMVARYGADLVAALKAADPADLDRDAEKHFELVAADPRAESIYLYGDVDYRGKARSELFEMRHLAIGKTAPDIVGEDVEGVEFKLSDYRGKVIFLDFWGHW